MVCERRVDAMFECPVQRTPDVLGEEEERLRHIEGLMEKWIKCENHLPNNYG